VAHDYRSILKELYDEFGEDFLQAARASVADQLRNGAYNREQSVSAEETGTGPGDGREMSDPGTYHDADHFERRHLNRTRDGLVAAGSAADVLGAFRVLVEGAVEVAKFEEAQITVRADIAAQRDVALAQIANQKSVLLAYLEKSFDERKENFRRLFSVVDHALENNNMEELGLGLESIIKLAESSPFRDLASIDTTAAALGDPEHEWDF
jgi:hypothetical protein